MAPDGPGAVVKKSGAGHVVNLTADRVIVVVYAIILQFLNAPPPKKRL